MTTIADLVLACGMCVVTAYGVLVGAAGWVKYRNARRRAEAEAQEMVDQQPGTLDASGPLPQPA